MYKKSPLKCSYQVNEELFTANDLNIYLKKLEKEKLLSTKTLDSK